MNHTVIDQLIELTTGKSLEDAHEAVNNYFDHIVWSLEKQEYDSMTTKDKLMFANKLRNM